MDVSEKGIGCRIHSFLERVCKSEHPSRVKFSRSLLRQFLREEFKVEASQTLITEGILACRGIQMELDPCNYDESKLVAWLHLSLPSLLQLSSLKQQRRAAEKVARFKQPQLLPAESQLANGSSDYFGPDFQRTRNQSVHHLSRLQASKVARSQYLSKPSIRDSSDSLHRSSYFETKQDLKK